MPRLRGSQVLPPSARVEHAGRRDADPDLVLVMRMDDQRVQDQAGAAGMPVFARRVVPQSLDMRPGLAPIVAAEQAGRLHAGIEAAVARGEAPHRLDRLFAGLVGEAFAGMRPGLAEIGRISRPPGRTIHCRRRHRSCRSAGSATTWFIGHVSQNGPRNVHCRRSASLSAMKAPFLVPSRTRVFVRHVSFLRCMIAAVVSSRAAEGDGDRPRPSEIEDA